MIRIITLVFFTLFLSSCSSDDDVNNHSSLNPPTWIQGTWLEEDEYGDVGIEIGYRFTEDDLCTISGPQTYCLKNSINLAQTRVEEEITNTDYILTLHNTVVTNTFHFRKYSENQIIFLIGNDVGAVFTKQ